jgi:HlyD family secretion protein
LNAPLRRARSRIKSDRSPTELLGLRVGPDRSVARVTDFIHEPFELRNRREHRRKGHGHGRDEEHQHERRDEGEALAVPERDREHQGGKDLLRLQTSLHVAAPLLLPPKRLSTSGLGTVDLSTYLGPATRRFGAYRGGTSTRWKSAASLRTKRLVVYLSVDVTTRHPPHLTPALSDAALAVPRTRCGKFESDLATFGAGSLLAVALFSMIQAAPHADGLLAAPTRRMKVRHARVGRRLVVVVVALVVAAALAALAVRAITRPARVSIANVEVGTVRQETLVKKGQLLATLDPVELRARSASAQRAVASAQQDVALAEANLVKARSDVELARANYQRADKLVGPGIISKADFDQTKAALSASEASQQAARVAIDARRADLARFVQDGRVADTVLSYTSITSPMDGVITRRALESGSTVGPGVTIFEIVDPNALWVATLIDESQTGRVEIGQRAIIHLRSGVDVDGHVSRVTLSADPVTRELEVDVAFDARPSRFAINEEADVTILGTEQSGPAVPVTAISHAPDGDVVFVVENGRAVRRHVRMGATGRGRAVVTDGLTPGEPVILSPQAVHDGERVVGTKGA